MDRSHPVLKIKVQIYCGDEIAMGPGKADLLDRIAAEGSISAAGRALGMSYRRAWLLVDAMNRCWLEPLVETSPGAASGSGARITPFGIEVLRLYRRLLEGVGGVQFMPEWQDLQERILPDPIEHQKTRAQSD